MMIKKIFNNKYMLIFIVLVVLYKNFTYEGESIELLTAYATNYNKDFMVKNENCSEEFDKLSLPLRWVIRNHKKTYIYKRDIILIFLKQYNCQFSKHGQSYELKWNPFFGYKLAEPLVAMLRKYNYGVEFVTTFDAYIIIDKIKGLECDELIKKELNITYKLYKQRGMEIEKYPECNKSNIVEINKDED